MEGPEISEAALEEITPKSADEESEISEAALEEIIPKAVKGEKEALELLMNHTWFYHLLNRIADWALRIYKVDKGRHKAKKDSDDDKDRDDCQNIQDVVSSAIRRKITALENPNNKSWRACLRAYCYGAAKRHCLNVINRDRPLEQHYQDSVRYDNTEGRRNGKEMLSPRSTILSEKEEDEMERQESFQESQISKIVQTMWRIFVALTPEEKRIASLWAEDEMTYHQIAISTNSSTETVRRKLKNIQKTFTKELGNMIRELGEATEKEVDAEPILKTLMEHRAGGLRQLIASCLREMARFNHARHAGT